MKLTFLIAFLLVCEIGLGQSFLLENVIQPNGKAHPALPSSLARREVYTGDKYDSLLSISYFDQKGWFVKSVDYELERYRGVEVWKPKDSNVFVGQFGNTRLYKNTEVLPHKFVTLRFDSSFASRYTISSSINADIRITADSTLEILSEKEEIVFYYRNHKLRKIFRTESGDTNTITIKYNLTGRRRSGTDSRSPRFQNRWKYDWNGNLKQKTLYRKSYGKNELVERWLYTYDEKGELSTVLQEWKHYEELAVDTMLYETTYDGYGRITEYRKTKKSTHIIPYTQLIQFYYREE